MPGRDRASKRREDSTLRRCPQRNRHHVNSSRRLIAGDGPGEKSRVRLAPINRRQGAPQDNAKWRGPACSNSAIIEFVRKQLLLQVLRGTADANIRFDDLRSLLTALGFVERVKGSHHIFSKPDVMEILNLQPRGSLAKPYQVKQVRAVIVRYKLAEGIQ